jgi:hypothetical protein
LAAFALGDGMIRTMMATTSYRALPPQAQTHFVRLNRNVAGGVGLVGALVVARVLGEEGPGSPGNFALLFLVATISSAFTIFLALRIRDPEPTAGSAYPRSGGALANRAFWRFSIFRLALGGTALIDPFLVLYAVQELSATASTVGWLIALFVIGQLLSWPLWTAVAHRTGARASFQLMAVARIIAAVVAFAVPELVQTQQWADRVGPGQAAALLFGTSLFFVGATHAGLRAVESDYVSRLAPAGSFPGVLAATRFVAMSAALSPLLGAWIIERTGAFQDAFLVGGAFSLLALLVSGLLPLTLIRSRTVTAAPSVAGSSGSSEVQAGEQLQTRPSS